MLDVSCVINDPLISDTFDVRRNAETVGSNGRTVKTPENFLGLRGIVTTGDSQALERRDDSQVVPHTISVITQFALRDASFGFQPDVVIWDGREYLVVDAQPHQRVAGFTEATCASTRATDAPR